MPEVLGRCYFVLIAQVVEVLDVRFGFSKTSKRWAAVTCVAAALLLTMTIRQCGYVNRYDVKEASRNKTVLHSDRPGLKPVIVATPRLVSQVTAVLGTSHLLSAYSAVTAQEALKLLSFEDPADPMIRNLLKLIRTTCKSAAVNVSRVGVSLIRAGQTEKLHLEASTAYLANYCGDSESLVAAIDASLSASAQLVQHPPKNYQDLEKLFNAGVKTPELADAFINEVLIAVDPDQARNIAMMLSAGLEPGGPLVKWRELFPPHATTSEFVQSFTIAGELTACQRSGGCRANQPLTFFTCLLPANCVAGEDLLSYRRRTTSPMLYKAAEQIAAAMQARRYR